MFREKYIDSHIVYYSDLIPELEHYFTTREINVEDNFPLHCQYLGVSKEDLIHPIQTHSTNICFACAGKYDYPDTDGLILTNYEQGVFLRFADCTPIILYNKKENIAAITHAGWRGTVGRIAPKTVKKIMDYSNSELSDFYAVIGPSIGQCCYQVGEEVINMVKNSVINFKSLITSDNRIDLKGINAKQLTELGIPAENIDICPFCTSCRKDLFYSYRKENGTDKRHNAVIKLKRLN